MKLIRIATLLTLSLIGATSAPTLSIVDKGVVTARFEKGAAEACFRYQSTTETIEQGGVMVPYTPASCWLLNGEETSISDNVLTQYVPEKGKEWITWVEVIYFDPEPNPTNASEEFQSDKLKLIW